MLVTSRLTEVEVRRDLARLLDGDDLERQRRALAVDVDVFALVALDATTMNAAARIAESRRCADRSIRATSAPPDGPAPGPRS